MKYLRGYNEALTADQQLALQDLCDAHFAYLYDEGFELAITERRRTADRHIQSILANTYLANSQKTFATYIITLSSKKSFQVEDVKDYFEPFLDSLKRNNVNIYGISVKGISHYSYGTHHADNLDFITNDQLAKVSGMIMTINTPSRGKEVRQLLTSVSVEVLEYDLARAQVINESKTYLDMKYTSSMFFDYLNKLRDFCEGNLVYLLDDGFEVTVKPKPDDKILVRIWKPSSDNGSRIKNLTSIKVTDEFKDYVMPFLQRIKSNYDIASIVFNTYTEELRSTRYKDMLINDVNEVETLSGYISCVDIEIKEVEKQIINESFSYSDDEWEEMELDLEEYCNSNLAFLLDEGFEIYINPMKTIDKFYVTLYKVKNSNESQIFDLDDIKDHIIPFINRLKKDYNVESIILIRFERKVSRHDLFNFQAYSKSNIRIENTDELDNLSGTLHSLYLYISVN